MPEQIETDVAIIGAGPVGLFAAFECGMLKLRSVLVDALERGRRPVHGALSGEADLRHPRPSGDRRRAPDRQPRGADRAVRGAAPAGPPGRPAVGRRRRLHARHRQGRHGPLQGGDAGRRRRRVRPEPAAAGRIDAFEETGGVQYLVKRREDFRGRRVVIAGGGDSAVDWALSLREVAEKVFVVHRRAKFRAAPETAAQLERRRRPGRAGAGDPLPAARAARRGWRARGGRGRATSTGSTRRARSRLPAAVLRPVDGSRPDRRLGPRSAAQPRAGRRRRPAKPARRACSRSATSPPTPASSS